MEPAAIAGDSPAKLDGRREKSGTAFPVYDLTSALMVAKAIHEKGGGAATDDQLAAFLNYKSPRNGGYLGRLAAARLFGLVQGRPTGFTLTPLAQTILMPLDELQHKRGLVDAFLNVPLFKGVYEECKGKELPPEFGMKNLFRQKFKIIPSRLGNAYRVMMDSADTAGFFNTRGARSHLIMPQIGGAPTVPEVRDRRQEPQNGGSDGSDGGSGDGGHADGPRIDSLDDLRREYVSMLMEMLREKAKSGEADPDLMERIEKLLAIN